MLQMDCYTAEVIMKTLVEERLCQTEKRRLLRQAGIDQPGWLFRQSCWLLRQLGRGLVVLGQRLQQVGAPQVISLEAAKVLSHE